MEKPPVIDAEFVVVRDPRPKPEARWSFWSDDFPNLCGIAGGLAALIVMRLLLRDYWPF